MTHERKQNILLFFQGFIGVTLLGSGLIMMVRAAASGAGWAAVGPLLMAMATIVCGGGILAPGIARTIASPAGRLFYPQKPLEPQPLFSLPRGLRQSGRFEEALDEYRQVVQEFPECHEAYLEMIEMAVSQMEDYDLGRELLLKAMVTVQGENARRELRNCFDCAVANREIVRAKPARIAFDLFDDETEGVHGEQ